MAGFTVDDYELRTSNEKGGRKSAPKLFDVQSRKKKKGADSILAGKVANSDPEMSVRVIFRSQKSRGDIVSLMVRSGDARESQKCMCSMQAAGGSRKLAEAVMVGVTTVFLKGEIKDFKELFTIRDNILENELPNIEKYKAFDKKKEDDQEDEPKKKKQKKGNTQAKAKAKAKADTLKAAAKKQLMELQADGQQSASSSEDSSGDSSDDDDEDDSDDDELSG